MLLMVDRPSEKEQVKMLIKSLQLRYERHIATLEITDFTALKNALFRVEDVIAWDLWSNSFTPSSTNRKGKRSAHLSRQTDVVAIVTTRRGMPRSGRAPPFGIWYRQPPTQMKALTPV